MSPVGNATSTDAMSPASVPTFRLSRACSRCVPRSSQNAPTALTTKDAVTSEAIWLCAYCASAQGLSSVGPEVGQREAAVRAAR